MTINGYKLLCNGYKLLTFIILTIDLYYQPLFIIIINPLITSIKIKHYQSLLTIHHPQVSGSLSTSPGCARPRHGLWNVGPLNLAKGAAPAERDRPSENRGGFWLVGVDVDWLLVK